MGYTMLDAVFGAPGTFKTFDAYGRLGWGFSIDLYLTTWKFIDAQRAWAKAQGFDPDIVPTTGYGVLVRMYMGIDSVSYGLIPELLDLIEEQKFLNRTIPKKNLEMWVSMISAGGDATTAMLTVMQFFMGADPSGRQWLNSLDVLFHQTISWGNQYLGMLGLPPVKAQPLFLLLFTPELLDEP